MRTFALVPVLNEWHLTAALLDSLRGEPLDDLLILNDGSTDGTPSKIRRLQRVDSYWRHRLHQTDRTGANIYEAWSRGFERARTLAHGREFYVLIANNDVELPRGAIDRLRVALSMGGWASYPDYDAPWQDEVPANGSHRATSGVLSSGGMLGACFMLAGHRIPWSPLITDPNYQWWFADDHLAECIEQEGGTQWRCEGLPVKHVNEGTAQHYADEIYLKKMRDRGAWITRESRGRRAVDRRERIAP